MLEDVKDGDVVTVRLLSVEAMKARELPCGWTSSMKSFHGQTVKMRILIGSTGTWLIPVEGHRWWFIPADVAEVIK